MKIIERNTVGKLMLAICLLLAAPLVAPRSVALAQSGEEARQPWQQIQRFSFFPFGEGQHYLDYVVYKVPANKRLVIEFVTYDVSAEKPWFRFKLSTRAGGVSVLHTLVVSEDNTCSKLFRLYADPDSEVVLRTFRSGISGSFYGTFTLSGYLLDVVP